MCIAVYIPEKKNLTDQQIKNCFANNPDGAGIMWQENGKVHIQKGFFKVEELIKAFREIPITVPRGLHCRIATSGKISTECCHPFPIIKDIKSMGRAECIVDSAVIHNGVISFCTPHEGLLSPFSDTMVFARDFLYPMGNKINTQAFKILFEQSNTSKLLIFNKDKIIRMGTWIEDGGVYFSNSGYKDTWKEGTSAAFTGKKFSNKAAMDANNYAFQQIFMNMPVTSITSSVDANNGFWQIVDSKTTVTDIADIANAKAGVAYCIEVADASKNVSISKAAKFEKITAEWKPTQVGDYILVVLDSDGNFLELELLS